MLKMLYFKLGFYINYVACKLGYIIKNNFIIQKFYINYVACKWDGVLAKQKLVF